ncbi:MAG: tetratricopeptide repeat protein [Saprospiraceae bacterium]|nr:tetratricopeptide repeat protein [Saprospiraceae bacterium]
MSSSRLDQLLTFHKESPTDSFILFALAKEYENQSELEIALQYYQQLTKNAPNYIGTYYHLGKLHERMDQAAFAFQTYKKGMAIAKKIGDQHALGELAGAKLALGDDEDFE